MLSFEPLVQYEEHTLKGTEFRMGLGWETLLVESLPRCSSMKGGMFPHLLYSAKLFQVLSRCSNTGSGLNPDIGSISCYANMCFLKHVRRTVQCNNLFLCGKCLIAKAFPAESRVDPTPCSFPTGLQPTTGVPPHRNPDANPK